ncbi:MAG: hypothetical protein ABSG86_14390 [Thermoguttaceae bacterium]
MKALGNKVLVGCLATTLLACGSAALAAGGAVKKPVGPPAGAGGPHPAYHPHPVYHHHPPVVHGRVGVVVLGGVDTTAMDATDATPDAQVRLVNPAENRVTLRYTLDGGPVQSLAAGDSVDIAPQSVLEFGRGGSAGRARVTLTDGQYRFARGNGSWRLVHDPL